MTLNRSRKAFLFSTILSSVAVLVAGDAFAQTKSAASNQLEEIVVTARKTSERLQTTPVAVTAITPQALERRQLQQVIDVQRSTPGLLIGSGGTAVSTAVYIAIRGNAQNSPNSASDAAIGIYVDGVYYARPMMGNLGLDDLSSVEVLRGPQGTLFGRNTTGGALNITTQDPTDKFEGHVKVGIGNYDLRQTEGVVNVPLSEDFATRLSAAYSEHSGYVNGPVQGAKFMDVDGDYSTRINTKWSPSNLPLTWKISGDFSHYRDNGSGGAAFINPDFVVGGAPIGLLFQLATGSPTFTQYNNTHNAFFTAYGKANTGVLEIDTPFNRNVAKGIASNLDVDLGELHLKSITAYRDSHSQNAEDLDGTPADISAFASDYIQKQFSQELQLSGKIEKLDWTTGLYYFRESGSERSDSQILFPLQGLTAAFLESPAGGGFPAPIAQGIAAGALPSFNRYLTDFRASSVGAFAQLNYHVTDRVRLTGGFRYTWDTRIIISKGENWQNFGQVGNTASILTTNIVNGALNPAAGICSVAGLPAVAYSPACALERTANFKYPAWVASIDFQATDELFLYLKTSGAAMAGGFNTRTTPPGLNAFNPEKVKDVELGFKADLLDKRLRTNGAIFYMERNGVQNIVNEFSQALGLTQYVRNVGKLRAYGAEFEGTALPWEGMEVTTSVSYLHSKYAAGSFVIQGATGPIDRSGEPAQQAPKWTFSVGGTQWFEMPWGKASIHADYAYVSSRVYYQDTLDASATAAAQAQQALANQFGILKGYGVLNGRIAFNINEPDIEIAFWGRNLTNRKFMLNESDFYANLGTVIQYQGAPRTYGATVSYHW